MSENNSVERVALDLTKLIMENSLRIKNEDTILGMYALCLKVVGGQSPELGKFVLSKEAEKISKISTDGPDGEDGDGVMEVG